MSILKYLKTEVSEVAAEDILNDVNDYFQQDCSSQNDLCVLDPDEPDESKNICFDGMDYGYCKICQRHFHMLKLHLSAFHFGKDEKRCSVCGIMFLKKSKLYKHILKHADCLIKCNYCSRTGFVDFEQLNDHLEEHEYLHIYICERCNKGFSVRSNYEDHIISHGSSWKVSLLKCLKCAMCCDPRDLGIKRLSKHWIEEHGKNFKCDDCSKKFNKFIVFYIHCLRHSNQLPFKCEHCGLVFRKECRLNEHVNATHLNIYNYICSICGAKFKYQNMYDIHLRSHDESLQFSCNYCSKLFLRKHSLISHFFEKYCTVCDEKFFCRSMFEKHYEVNHKSERLFNCALCPKRYSLETALKRHITVVHPSKSEPTLKCPSCPFKTATRRNLNRHKRRNHLLGNR